MLEFVQIVLFFFKNNSKYLPKNLNLTSIISIIEKVNLDNMNVNLDSVINCYVKLALHKQRIF